MMPRCATSAASSGGGADLELHVLGRLLADRDAVPLLDVGDDRLVEVVPADAHRLRDDDPAERDDGDLARAPANVHDHVSDGLVDREAGSDRRRDRLLDQVDTARSRRQGGLHDRALLDVRDSRRRAHHDTGMSEARPVHSANEVTQHLLGDLEVRDHPVTQGPDRGDRGRSAADHALGVVAHRVHSSVQ
jgi:hypothetical protein